MIDIEPIIFFNKFSAFLTKVMFNFDFAELYRVETRALKQAVKSNLLRFPEDFMFVLNKDEWQRVITNCDNLPERIKFSSVPPMAFSELGVAMLSSVLKSETAIAVNIQIMRVFHSPGQLSACFGQ
jgi:hypothetical protein